MNVTCLHAQEDIYAYLAREPHLHLYELGDLDDFFWPYTTWYAHREDGQASQLFLVYTGTPLPVLLALSNDLAKMRSLLQEASPFLPKRFYAHFSGDLVEVFASDYRVESYGKHYKMALTDPGRLRGVDTQEVSPLTTADQGEITALYADSYPENWFDPRMLETGCYYGTRRAGKLISVAGVHVYSPRYRVAALGNITTHPAFRGRGLCSRVTARLCLALKEKVDAIGLNVKADNLSAIRCYQNLGFEWVADYTEYLLETKV